MCHNYGKLFSRILYEILAESLPLSLSSFLSSRSLAMQILPSRSHCLCVANLCKIYTNFAHKLQQIVRAFFICIFRFHVAFVMNLNLKPSWRDPPPLLLHLPLPYPYAICPTVRSLSLAIWPLCEQLDHLWKLSNDDEWMNIECFKCQWMPANACECFECIDCSLCDAWKVSSCAGICIYEIRVKAL